MSAACPNCHTSVSHGNTVGCCTACGRCFSGLSAFEAHQVGPRNARGLLICVDPETARHERGHLLFGESSRSKPGEPTIWRLWTDPSVPSWWEKAR